MKTTQSEPEMSKPEGPATPTEQDAFTDNPYATTNLLKEKKRCVFLRDFELMTARKEIKNDRSFRSVSYSKKNVFKSFSCHLITVN